MAKELDRRSFLKGMLSTGAAAAAVTAAVSLPACSPSTASDTSGSTGSTGSTGSGSSSTSGIGKHTWEVVPAPITDISDTQDFDIVIIGAGLAGLSAAEAAARNGAKVAVLERTDAFQVRGVDVGHIGSQWHIKNGFDIDPRIPARFTHLWSHQTTNYNLIYTWASRSGKVFDYIEQLCAPEGVYMVHALSGTAKYGWDTLPERWRVYPDAVSFVSDDNPGQTRTDGNSSTWTLGQILYNAAIANGAEYIFNTHAEQLVGDAQSGVTGVIAKDNNNKYIQYNASKGVILATGDVSGNQEMIDAFAPICNRADGNVYTPVGGNTGDALLMTSWIGGAISKSPVSPMVHQFTLDSISFNLTAFIMCWLAVDENGMRYGAELPFEPYLTNARMNTPGNKAWSIFDADYAKYVQQQWPTKYTELLDGIEDEMATRIQNKTLFKADTLEDLASQLGIPVDNFTAAVTRYNTMMQNGEDDDFEVPAQFLSQVQTAPFYATPLVCSVLTIPFGVHVNDDSQVCTIDDAPIGGLFAIGNAQGDFFGLDYPVHFPGISQGRCVTFGQLVGEALAQDTVITKTM